MTDSRGRVSRASFRLGRRKSTRDTEQQRLAGGADRRTAQATPRRLSKNDRTRLRNSDPRYNPREYDAGGHLAPTERGGPPDGINLVAQDFKLNSNHDWRDFERDIGARVDAGSEIDVTVVPKYHGDGERPDWFKCFVYETAPDGTQLPPREVIIRNHRSPS